MWKDGIWIVLLFAGRSLTWAAPAVSGCHQAVCCPGVWGTEVSSSACIFLLSPFTPSVFLRVMTLCCQRSQALGLNKLPIPELTLPHINTHTPICFVLHCVFLHLALRSHVHSRKPWGPRLTHCVKLYRALYFCQAGEPKSFNCSPDAVYTLHHSAVSPPSGPETYFHFQFDDLGLLLLVQLLPHLLQVLTLPQRFLQLLDQLLIKHTFRKPGLGHGFRNSAFFKKQYFIPNSDAGPSFPRSPELWPSARLLFAPGCLQTL